MSQLLEFHNIPTQIRQSFHDQAKDPVDNYSAYVAIRDKLVESGVRVEDIPVDIPDFRKRLKAYPEIDLFYRGSANVHIEKCLEHYLSFSYMDLSPDDTFIDIAASGSPYSEQGLTQETRDCLTDSLPQWLFTALTNVLWAAPMCGLSMKPRESSSREEAS